MSVINPDQLAEAIKKALEEFEGVTEEAVRAGVTQTAKEAVSDLQGAQPSGSGRYGSWTSYNNGWTATKTTAGKKSIGAVVHNKSHYQLAHLLENGHALKNGGRAQAFPHIAPVAEQAEDNLLKNIRNYLKGE